MVRTLADDLRASKGWSLELLLHRRWSGSVDFAPDLGVTEVSPEHPFQIRLGQALRQSDAVWLIAPEGRGILETLSRQVLDSGCRLLGVPPQGVALTADKLQTGYRLRRHGFATPETVLSPRRPPSPPPWVLKPRDGCGSDSVSLVGVEDPLPDGGGWLLQTWIQGESYSLSLACDAGKGLLLSVNRQLIVRQGRRLALSACRIGVSPPFEAEALAARIAAAFPELRGYVGVDLVYDGRQVWVIELNPRLTLSFVGLSRASGRPVGVLLTRWLLGEMALAELAKLWSWKAVRPVLV